MEICNEEKSKKIEAAIERLEQKFMRNVTPVEIAVELNISEDDVYSSMNEHFFANILSIDEQPQDQDDKEGTKYYIKDHHAELPENHQGQFVELTKAFIGAQKFATKAKLTQLMNSDDLSMTFFI